MIWSDRLMKAPRLHVMDHPIQPVAISLLGERQLLTAVHSTEEVRPQR